MLLHIGRTDMPKVTDLMQTNIHILIAIVLILKISGADFRL